MTHASSTRAEALERATRSIVHTGAIGASKRRCPTPRWSRRRRSDARAPRLIAKRWANWKSTSVFPVTWAPLQMGDGHDHNLGRPESVEDLVRKLVQQHPSGLAVGRKRRSDFRIGFDEGERRDDRVENSPPRPARRASYHRTASASSSEAASNSTASSARASTSRRKASARTA
jgi:hypothetical protein